MKHIIILLIRIYQVSLSPILRVLFGAQCRYEESCSKFAIRVIKEKGVLLGTRLALLRLLSCQPFGRIVR